MYNFDQPVMKSYFQPQLKLQFISDKSVNKCVRSTIDRLCDAQYFLLSIFEPINKFLNVGNLSTTPFN